jgi:hypothetical protein
MRADDARRLLATAAALAGGVAQLATRLQVSERVLRHCIEGQEPIPESLYLMVLDLLVQELEDEQGGAKSG